MYLLHRDNNVMWSVCPNERILNMQMYVIRKNSAVDFFIIIIITNIPD